MSISKISIITTAVAVILASANVIIHAVKEDSMTAPLIILGIVFAAFIFSVIVVGNKKKKQAEEITKTEE